jgi:hypothetical protein
MDPRTLRSFSDHLLLGGLVVATGSAAGLWLPPGAAILLLALLLCRVCWIEDNIHQDLLPSETLPPGYRACRERRRGLVGTLFGDAPDATDCPKRLASVLRLQSHAWAAFAWGLSAGVALHAGAPYALAAGGLALLLALRQADYLALGASLMAQGGPLPLHLIARRGVLTQLAVIPRRPD